MRSRRFAIIKTDIQKIKFKCILIIKLTAAYTFLINGNF
jgi:hypothetical protein